MLKQKLGIVKDYLKRGFNRFVDYMDKQSIERGNAFFEAREAREKRRYPIFGAHLSTINPEVLNNILEDMIETYYI